MPRPDGCPPQEGKVEPASTNLCPVAREYPSRALGELFQPPALRLFYQGTRKNVGRTKKNVKQLLCSTYSPPGGCE
jgi:hypothetical protein